MSINFLKKDYLFDKSNLLIRNKLYLINFKLLFPLTKEKILELNILNESLILSVLNKNNYKLIF